MTDALLSAVLTHIKASPGITRYELTRRCNASLAEIEWATRELVKRGVVVYEEA